MAPMSQLDRIEHKIDRMDVKLDKVDRITAVHGAKIKANSAEITAIKGRGWAVIVLVLGGFITACYAAVTGK